MEKFNRFGIPRLDSLHQDDPLAPALLPVPSIELGLTSTDGLDMNSGENTRSDMKNKEIER
jgi:hypothetical protein